MEQKIPGVSKFPGNRARLSKIFEMKFSKIAVSFDSVAEFQEILVEWMAPCEIRLVFGINPVIRIKNQALILQCGDIMKSSGNFFPGQLESTSCHD